MKSLKFRIIGSILALAVLLILCAIMSSSDDNGADPSQSQTH